MHVGTKGVDEALQQIDVVVEVEAARRERNEARVDPVGHVEIVVRQEPRHGVAQERGVVPGERRDHEHLRIAPRRVALEVDQVAERRLETRQFAHRHGPAVDLRGREPEGRLGIAARGPLQELAGGNPAWPQSCFDHGPQGERA
jgi:hypothetical protein